MAKKRPYPVANAVQDETMDYDEDGNKYEAETTSQAPYSRLGNYNFVTFCHELALGQRY